MKKLLILALMSLFSFTIKADTTSVLQDVKNTIVKVDTASLSKQIYSDFKSGIEAAASALKLGVSEVWRVLIKQQIVKSIISLLIPIFILLCSIIFYRQLKYNEKEFKLYRSDPKTSNWEKGRDENSNGIATIIYSILFIGCIIASVATLCTNFNTIVTGFINPEYGAMQDIINFVK